MTGPQLLGRSKHEKEIVFDPMAGTGTNIIACEDTKRIAYMMEIDPRYCQVIVDRWQSYTGQKAEKLNGV